MLREQPSLSAWGRPAGWVPRPHVRRRAWMANTVEGLVRSHDPRRGVRTRADYRLSQVKCGEDSGLRRLGSYVGPTLRANHDSLTIALISRPPCASMLSD